MGPEAERNFWESQLIILDTLEQVLNSVSGINLFILLLGAPSFSFFLMIENLNSTPLIVCCMFIPVICLTLQQPKDTSRLDEALYVKLLLPEICKVGEFITAVNVRGISSLQ